jgi:hypothetical protein
MPPGPCRIQPRLCPFPDQVPFKLGQGPEDLKDQPAAAGGVESFLQADKIRSLPLQTLDNLNQVYSSCGPTDPAAR